MSRFCKLIVVQFRNDNGEDVYAHYTAITRKNPNHRVRSLNDGELVRFNLIEGSKGIEASDITGLDGGSVEGSKYARTTNSSSFNNDSIHQSPVQNTPRRINEINNDKFKQSKNKAKQRNNENSTQRTQPNRTQNSISQNFG